MGETEEQKHVLIREDEIVEVGSWDDMESDPEFVADLDPSKLALGRPIGHYKLWPHKPCRISSCHTKHGEGWFVELKNKKRSYIGVLCGLNHYPALKQMAKAFNRVNKRRLARKRVSLLTEELLALLPKARQFLNSSGNTVVRLMDEFYKLPVVTGQLKTELRRMLQTGTREIQQTRRRSREEQDEVRAMNPMARQDEVEFETIVVGTLQGLRAQNITHIRKLVPEIESSLALLQATDLDRESVNKINSNIRIAEEAKARFDLAKEVAESFKQFARKSNIAQLHLLLPRGGQEQEALKNLTLDASKARWRTN
jgi:hypothetical protein